MMSSAELNQVAGWRWSVVVNLLALVDLMSEVTYILVPLNRIPVYILYFI